MYSLRADWNESGGTPMSDPVTRLNAALEGRYQDLQNACLARVDGPLLGWYYK